MPGPFVEAEWEGDTGWDSDSPRPNYHALTHAFVEAETHLEMLTGDAEWDEAHVKVLPKGRVYVRVIRNLENLEGDDA